MVRNTKGEQWTAKPQAHRKQNIRALCLGAQESKCFFQLGLTLVTCEKKLQFSPQMSEAKL